MEKQILLLDRSEEQQFLLCYMAFISIFWSVSEMLIFFIANFISALFNSQKIGLLKNNATNREEYTVYVSHSQFHQRPW